MSIITHYYSKKFLKSSRDNKMKSLPDSGYIRCHVSSSNRLFICCHSNLVDLTVSALKTMTDPAQTSSSDLLLKELLGTVSSLQKEVADLKEQQANPRKRPRDGDTSAGPIAEHNRDGEESSNEDSDRDEDRDSEPEQHGGDKEDDSSVIYQISEEGQAFLESSFASRLKYQTRQAKVTKYGTPDTKWLQCPRLSPVVEATLSKEAVSQDQKTFRCQEMWLEAARPLTACLEKAHAGTLTLQETMPMLQNALMLMGDASQHQSSFRRKKVLEHLNPQLKGLMKEEDFAAAQPFLFGEEFGAMAKSRLEATAALKKIVYPQSNKGKQGFQGGYPRKFNRASGGSHQSSYGPGKSKKGTMTKADKGRK